MKILVALGIVIIVAVLTNPKLMDHKEALKSAVGTAFTEAMADEIRKGGNSYQAVGTALGLNLGMTLLDNFINNMVTVDNYIVVSFTRVTFDGNSRIVGWGAFGNVWISDEVGNAFRKNEANAVQP